YYTRYEWEEKVLLLRKINSPLRIQQENVIVKTKHDVSDNSSGVRHIYCENNLRNFQCLKTVNNTKAERIFGFVNAHRSRQHCCQFLSEQRKNVV
ncbi:MAG: hypothetical protein ACLT0W_08170, partial [Clostridium sp.]